MIIRVPKKVAHYEVIGNCNLHIRRGLRFNKARAAANLPPLKPNLLRSFSPLTRLINHCVLLLTEGRLDKYPPVFVEGDQTCLILKDELDKLRLPWKSAFPPIKEKTFDLDANRLTVAKSNNRRLERLFGRVANLLNREIVFPLRVKEPPLFFHHAVKKSAKLQQLIRDNLFFIILPSILRPLRWSVLINKLTVLASPRRCGRVLELDEPVMIDNQPRVLALKGVGATAYVRDMVAEQNLSLGGGLYPPLPHLAARLKHHPFLLECGLLNREKAAEEVEMTKKLLGIGVDAPLILAVFEITALPNQSGKYYPVAYYRDVKGLIPKGLRPAVLVRAAKSNFRLADFFDLAKQGTAEEVRRFIDYAVKEFGQFEKVNEPTVEKYFQFLVAKIIRQKKAMEPLGLRNPNNVWENLATNLTILGKEIDVGDLKPQAWDDGETQTMPLMAMTVKTLTKLGNLINKYHPQKVNLAILPKTNKE